MSERKLIVSKIECKDLLSVGKVGSDVYAVLSLRNKGEMKDYDKKERFAMPQTFGNISPEWDMSCEFGNMYPLNNCKPGSSRLPILYAQVYHKSSFAIAEVPLGACVISLDDILDTKPIRKTIKLDKCGRMDKVSGEISLTIQFNMMCDDDDDDDDESTPLIESELTSSKEGNVGAVGPPNDLVVKISKGKDLKIVDKNLLSKGGSSDPYVTVVLNTSSQKETTSTKKNTVNPEWNESFRWSPVTNDRISITLSVYDKGLTGSTFMGKVSIDLDRKTFNSTSQPLEKWYKLSSESGAIDTALGELRVSVHWRYDYDTQVLLNSQEGDKKKSSITGALAGAVNKIGGAVTAGLGYADNDKNWGLEAVDDEIDVADDGDSESEESKKQKDQKRAKRDEEQKKISEEEDKKKKELDDIDIKSGDYQIQVHVIEARDLKAENYDGTSDPVVYVEAFGQKQNTQVVGSCTSCVFDDTLIFNVKNVDKELFEGSIIRVSCYDAQNITGRKTMIGAYAVDCTYIYTLNKQHEIYRKWVPLMDDEDSNDVGVQGYLKLSIQIIGPGEKISTHSDADIEKELKEEAAAGGDIGTLCLATPVIPKSWQFLVVSVYCCEGLPVMDGNSLVSSAKVDAICSVTVAGGKPFPTFRRTTTSKGGGRRDMNPIYNCEIWYPVSFPVTSNLIKFGVYDEDSTKLELIGGVTEKIGDIMKQPLQRSAIKWYNLYGPHEFKENQNITSNLVKGVRGFTNVMSRNLLGGENWKQYYHLHPSTAPSYKGRALLRFRIESTPPSGYKGKGIQPFGQKLKTFPKNLPSCSEYVLQAIVFFASELPVVSSKYKIRVQIGIHAIETSLNPVDSKGKSNAICAWRQSIGNDIPVVLPNKIDQIPDIFIYLVKEDDKPICYKRMKPYVVYKEAVADGKTVDKKRLLGFEESVEWVLLQEDKHINALPTNTFPGNLLIKVGLGLRGDAERLKAQWYKDMSNTEDKHKYEVRVHVYHGRNFPAADSDGGCDPYLEVSFQGATRRTCIRKKTLFPSYYETIVYNEVSISDALKFAYAPQIAFKLWDHDLDAPDYLGQFTYNLKHAVISKYDATHASIDIKDTNGKVRDPEWYSFFKEEPKDGEGELLVLVQLLPFDDANTSYYTKEGEKTIHHPIIKNSLPPLEPANKALNIPIKIETRSANVEIVVLGARELAPYNLLPMQAPYMEFEVVDSAGTKKTVPTNTSKKPSTSSPNFIQKMVLPMQIPVRSIYAPSVQVRARDKRLGGLSNPIVGTGSISLETKIPWYTSSFNNSNRKLLSGGSTAETGKDPVASAAEAEALQHAQSSAPDSFVATKEVKVDELVAQRKNKSDSGAGVFGALHHLPSGDMKKSISNLKASVFAQVNSDSEDEAQEIEPYRKIRQTITELEDKFGTGPFETCVLWRGQKNGYFGSTMKKVGLFKGFITVIPVDPITGQAAESADSGLDDLFKPKNYKLRLYCLKASALTPMDLDIWGKPAKSDPYMVVSLGNTEVYNGRSHCVNDVNELFIHNLVEIDVELPGTSQVKISIMDKDEFGKMSDDLIGSTLIDLEDRLFDARWIEWGQENLVTANNPYDKSKPQTPRWATKPIETRSLKSPSSKVPQGNLECWIDIMKPEVALAFPPENITLPPKQMFEVRVVVWKCKNVPAQDSFENMSDLFIKGILEGCPTIQETDTHWRAKGGKGSFNWRLIFDVELGPNTRAWKFPYLKLQIWDRDVLKWSDCAGEATINIGKYYKKAYMKNVAVKYPKEIAKGAMKLRKEREIDGVVKSSDDRDVAPAEEVNFNTVNPMPGTVDSDDDEAQPLSKKELEKKKAIRDAPDVSRISESVSTKHINRIDDTPVLKPVKPKVKRASVAASQKKVTTAPMATKKSDNNVSTDEKVVGVEELEKTKEELEKIKKELEKTKQGEKTEPATPEEVNELVKTIKDLTGLWPESDPAESKWIAFRKTDHNNPGKDLQVGEVCISVQIWPKEKAVLMRAGSGRSEPNQNPFLPPPVGRFKFSWNPFVLGSALCGPKLCCYFSCCLICAAFILIMIFCQPFINILINLFFVVWN